MKVLPNMHLDGKDSTGLHDPGWHSRLQVLDGTGFDVITATVSAPAAGSLCPQGLNFLATIPSAPRSASNLDRARFSHSNFFASGDGSQLYIVNANSSTILVYNFVVGSVIGGIELLNGATPVSADMSSDAGTIVIAGSDGMLHEVSTSVGGNDLVQLSFPNLPDYLNPFCTYSACPLNIALTKP